MSASTQNTEREGEKKSWDERKGHLGTHVKKKKREKKVGSCVGHWVVLAVRFVVSEALGGCFLSLVVRFVSMATFFLLLCGRLLLLFGLLVSCVRGVWLKNESSALRPWPLLARWAQPANRPLGAT